MCKQQPHQSFFFQKKYLVFVSHHNDLIQWPTDGSTTLNCSSKTYQTGLWCVRLPISWTRPLLWNLSILSKQTALLIYSQQSWNRSRGVECCVVYSLNIWRRVTCFSTFPAWIFHVRGSCGLMQSRFQDFVFLLLQRGERGRGGRARWRSRARVRSAAGFNQGEAARGVGDPPTYKWAHANTCARRVLYPPPLGVFPRSALLCVFYCSCGFSPSAVWLQAGLHTIVHYTHTGRLPRAHDIHQVYLRSVRTSVATVCGWNAQSGIHFTCTSALWTCVSHWPLHAYLFLILTSVIGPLRGAPNLHRTHMVRC